MTPVKRVWRETRDIGQAQQNKAHRYPPTRRISLLLPKHCTRRSLCARCNAATGSWHAVFIVAKAMNVAAALLAWFVLRPMRLAQTRKTV
jgi:hypothetical protein